MDYVTDIEFAAFLKAKGLVCLDVNPVDDKVCQFGFENIPEGLYKSFMQAYPPEPELQGIRAYRHIVADAQNVLRRKREGRQQ